jgi:phosphoadenosine phosphosulfate reductase
MSTSPAELDLAAANAELEGLEAHERIAWAAEHFKDGLVMSSSFGLQSAVLLHLANKVVPGILVVFIDTGYLFKETYNYAERLEKELDLNLKIYTSPITPARHEALRGQLWKQGPKSFEEYGLVRKVEPMNRAVKELGAKLWLTGLRRQQSSTRSELTIVERQNKMLKLHPIVDWNDGDVDMHLKANDLPQHPLKIKGYVTVGDTHSTRIPTEGESREAARPEDNFECGLHVKRSANALGPSEQFDI